MGLLKKVGMPSSDIRRLNGIIEAIIHVIIIASFLIVAHYFKFRITIAFALYIISIYFISAAAFHITRSIFRLVDKNLEKQALEEINVSIEEIPEKERTSLKDKLKNLIPKKEAKEVDTLNAPKTVVKEYPETIQEVPKEEPLPIETPIESFPIEEE